MPALAVNTAFMARLAANWTLTPIVSGNGPQEPPAGADAFVVVQYPVVNASKPVLQRTYWEEGAARIVLNVASGSGLEYGLGLQDQLASLFREVKFDGVETFSPASSPVNDANDDGQWFEFSVSVPYRYQFNG